DERLVYFDSQGLFGEDVWEIARTRATTLERLSTSCSVILPVVYTERFYADVLKSEVEEYCKLIYYNDIPVGAVCSRIETDEAAKKSKLYIMTMGVLAPYRSLGLGTYAIKHLLETASSPSTKPHLTSLYLHVQISNEAAKRFYERNGFKEVSVIDEYYKKIEPKAAWLMEWETPLLPADATEDAETATAGKAGDKQGAKAGGAKQGGKGGGKGGGGKKGRR
ncbi:3298_t:CDS:2, partial [Acaulospora colombiana]